MINNVFEYIYKLVFDMNQINDGVTNEISNSNVKNININTKSKSNNNSIKNNKCVSIDKKDYVNAREHCNIGSISESNKSSKNKYKNKTNPNDHHIDKRNITKLNNINIKIINLLLKIRNLL